MRVAWVVLFLATWLGGGQASASDLPLAVDFEDSARDLPQQEIRSAIEAELERQTLAEAGGPSGAAPAVPAERVTIALDEQGFWIKYQGPRGMVERHLPAPERADQIPVVVSLAVGNLVRQEAFELLRELDRQRAERATARALAPPPTAAELTRARERAAERQAFVAKPEPKPLPRRLINSFGLSATAELVHLGKVSSVCTPLTSNPDVECYVGSTPYSYSSPSEASTGIAAGMLFGARRLSLVYTRELIPGIAVSGRAGLALSGAGVVPWSAELRLRFFPGSGFWGGQLRPFLYLAAGVMWSQASVAVRIPEYDTPTGAGSEPTRYTDARAVLAYGWALAASGAGLRLGLSEHWWLDAELGVVVTFPQAVAVAWRPGLGLAYDF